MGGGRTIRICGVGHRGSHERVGIFPKAEVFSDDQSVMTKGFGNVVLIER